MMYGTMGLRNFWRQRRRNIFTVIAVTVGGTGLISLGGYIDRWEHTLRNDAIYLHGAGTIGIFKNKGLLLARSNPKRYTLNAEEQQRILAHLQGETAVEFVGSILNVAGLASNGCRSQPFEVTGYDAALDRQLRQKPEVKRWCEETATLSQGRDFASFPQIQLVGLARGLAKLIGKSTTLAEAQAVLPVQDLKAYCQQPGAAARIASDPNLQLLAVGFDGQFGAVDVDVAHIFSTGMRMTEDTKMTAPLPLVQELFQTDHVSSIAVYLHDYRDAPAVQARLAAAFKADGLDLELHRWDEQRISPFYVGIMSFLRVLGLFCSFLVGIVVVLSVVNLTTMNVLERSREIGTLKALGFRQFAITRIFLAEAAVLASCGCFAAWILARGIESGINGLNLRFHPPGFAQSVRFLLVADSATMIEVLTLVFALVLLTSGITSWILSRRSCVDLLSSHGG